MDNEISLQDIVVMLKRRRARIVMVMGLCLIPGLLAALILYPRYTATGTIEVEKSATDGLRLDNLTGHSGESQGAADALEASLTLQTQAKILESSSLALKVIQDQNLEKSKDFKPTFNPLGWALGFLNPSSGGPDLKGAALMNAPRRREHALSVFAKHLKIKPEAGTRLLHIRYTSSDPKIAAAVVNDMAKSLVDYTLDSRFAATTQVSGWLATQLNDIKRDAEQLQGKVEKLQRESGVYSLGISDAQGKEIAYSAGLDRLQQVTQELSAATSNRIVKGALYKSVESGDPELISGLAGTSMSGSSPAVNNDFALLQNLRGQQVTLSTQLASDSSKYGSANAKLLDEKASLEALNSQIQTEVDRIGARALNDYKAAQLVENNTRASYDELRKSADSLNDKAIALLIARQEATDARSLYQTLFSRLKEAGVVAGLRSSNISVVDAGMVPYKPRPDILICLGLSLVLGCFLGIALAIFAEATNDRVEGLSTIQNLLHVPVFAVLPTAESQAVLVSPGFVSRIRRSLGSGNQESEAAGIALLDGPPTAYLEALRGLRTSLIYRQGGPGPKTILVTSAAEREGKSTLSLNLAVSLVLNGARVLLVDADMRSAKLSGYMGFERSLASHEPGVKGLSDALTTREEPTLVQPFEKLPELWAVTAGPATKIPTELLGSESMRALAKMWAATFDYVLIDSPPVLAAADAIILAQLATTTLLVTRHGTSTQKSLKYAYEALRDIKDGHIGVVVNDVNRNSVSFDEVYGYKGKLSYGEV